MKSFFTGIIVCAILFTAGYLGYPYLETYIIQKPQVVVNKPKPLATPKIVVKPKVVEETKPKEVMPVQEKSEFVYLNKIPLFGLNDSGKPNTLEPLFQAMNTELNDDQIIALITAESAGVDAFKGNKITDFAVDELFIFEEKIYQVGLITYRKEGGIFGAQTIKAKALIRDGAISSWLNYSTNTPL